MGKTTKRETFTDVVLTVFRLGGVLINEGDVLTREYGITSARWKILGAISLAASPLSVPQIARSMGLTRQAVQRLVNAMYEDQLLDFQDNPDHKRAKLIQLTPHGHDVFAKLDIKQKQWAIAASHQLSQQELDTTLSVLKKIVAHFEP